MQDFHEKVEHLIQKTVIYHEKTPIKTESKWEVPFSDHQWYTGTTFCMIHSVSGRKYLGISHCIAIDEFDPARGEEIAKGRAEKALFQSEIEGRSLHFYSVFLRDGARANGFIAE